MGDSTGEVPLDDKKSGQTGTIFGKDSLGNRIFRPLALFKAPFSHLFSILAIALLCITITTIVLRAAYRTQGNTATVSTVFSHKEKSNGASASDALPTVPSSLSRLIAMMPRTVGHWTRDEANTDLLKVQDIGSDSSRTFVSTYKLGKSRVELWATEVLSSEAAGVALKNVATSTVSVHTDNGVVAVHPRFGNNDGIGSVAFDYSHGESTNWIEPTKSLFSGLSHSLTWYKAPYIITVASSNKGDRDQFVQAFSQGMRQF